MSTYTDADLLFSATERCKCGSGLAYPIDAAESAAIGAWVCAAVLRGDAGVAGWRMDSEPRFRSQEHDRFPWMFWKIREETSINNPSGATTRPAGTRALRVARATCGACGQTWESAPHHPGIVGTPWKPGPCPGCGLTNGSAGVTVNGPAIETRARTVVVPT